MIESECIETVEGKEARSALALRSPKEHPGEASRESIKKVIQRERASTKESKKDESQEKEVRRDSI